MIKKILLLYLLFSSSMVCAAIQVTVDHQQIDAGESFTLNITIDEQYDGSPDFAPLQQDFEILGTGRKTEFSLINGRSQTKKQWNVILMPKKDGQLTIPALKFGNEVTKPITITVMKSANAPKKEQVTLNNDIYIEAQVKPKVGFVQEQIIYTVKLYFRTNLEEAFLFPPELAGAHIVPMGQDIFYMTVKNGRHFRVLERNYVITPQQSGNLTIKPPVFRGIVAQDGNDLFSLYDFVSRPRKQVKLTGPSIQVAIKAKPKSFQGQWWLPAKNVTLRESWSMDPPRFKVGEPITREISITAIGAKGDQLPPIQLPTLPNINVYPEQQQVETKGDEQKMVGVLHQKITLVPTQAGKVRLPSVNVPWWNVNTHTKQIATLPERIIDVLPNAQVKQHQKTNQPLQVNQPFTKPENNWPVWFWWLIASFIIAVLFPIFFHMRRIKKVPIKVPTLTEKTKPLEVPVYKEAYSALKTACYEHHPNQACKSLITFAKAKWPDFDIHSPSDFIRIFQGQMSAELIAEFNQLDRILYASNSLTWDGIRFWTLFIDFAEKSSVSKPSVTGKELPSLYLK